MLVHIFVRNLQYFLLKIFLNFFYQKLNSFQLQFQKVNYVNSQVGINYSVQASEMHSFSSVLIASALGDHIVYNINRRN